MDEDLLVQRAQSGDETAVGALVDYIWPQIWHWAYGITGNRSLAEHVVQEATLRTFTALARFEPGRPLRPWLKRITINVALDELRRERRQRWRGEAEALFIDATFDEDSAFAQAVVEAVASLPSHQRIVVALHYWLDCPIDEIASILGVAVGTVASRLNRARTSLRSELEASRER